MCHNHMSNTVNIFVDKSEKLPGKEYTLMELSFKKLLDCYRNLQLQSDSLWYLICSDVVSKRLKICQTLVISYSYRKRTGAIKTVNYNTELFLATLEELFKIYLDIF